MIELFLALLALLGTMIGSLCVASMVASSAVHLETYRAKHPVRAHRVTRFLSPRSSESATMLAFDLLCVVFGTSALYFWGAMTSPEWTDDVVAELTFFASVFGLKSVCKAVGERFGNKILPFAALLLHALHIVFRPLTFAVEFLTRLISMPLQTEEESREEFDVLVKTARAEGTLDDSEYRILRNIMRFSEVVITDVMTPRTVMFSCSAEMTIGDAAALPETQMYSRFPVWDGDSIDGVVGYVLTRDVLRAALLGKRKQPLRTLMRDVHYIPENAVLEQALEEFLRRRQHLFVVVDEYGGVEGLVTMEDVMEMLLGVEIVDEADRVVDLRELAKQRRDRRVTEILAKGGMNPDDALEASAEDAEE